MEIITRVYEPRDLTEIVKLWYRTWHSLFPDIKHPHSYDVWEKRFHDELVSKGETWVAEVESQIVGFIVVFKNTCELRGIKVDELNQIFVDPLYQNRGIGTVLLKKAQGICPQGLTLKTLQSNTKACLFYEKHGFAAGKMSINEINGQPNIEYSWLPVDR